MAKNNPEAKKLILEYLDKYSSLPNRTLARKIHEEHRDVFKSVDIARGHIRLYKGVNGNKNRKDLKTKKYYVNDIVMPPSIERVFEPYICPESMRNTMVLSDLHVPFHNVKAVKLMIDYARDRKVDSVILNGDFLDFYDLSSFNHDPRLSSVKAELEAGKWMLDYIQERLNIGKMIYKKANHEARLDKYLNQNAKELAGLEELSLSNWLDFIGRNITEVADKRPIKYGKLGILHGDEYGGGFMSPVNPARSAFLKCKACVLVGHEHRSSSHSEQTMNGDQLASWSSGCLCELHPQYRPLNNHNHGAVHLTKDKEGNFEVTNLKIINGKIYNA